MSAQPSEQPPLQPDQAVIRAREALRNANMRWGQEIGVFEAEIHDFDSARAQAAADEAKEAGRKIDELRGNVKPQPQFGVALPPKGIFKALGKILGL